MVEPIESNTLHYEDKNVNISFRIGLRDVSFTILNKLNKPITLLYERAVYVDQMNLGHATVHSTLSLLTLKEYSPPKVIPPKTELLNYFAPIEKIESIHKWGIFVLVEPYVQEIKKEAVIPIEEQLLSGGIDAFDQKRKEKEWKEMEKQVEKLKERLQSELAELAKSTEIDKPAKSNVGKIIGVFLPVQIDGRVENYFFKFEIIDVKRVQSDFKFTLLTTHPLLLLSDSSKTRQMLITK
jgi:hypothetical protein